MADAVAPWLNVMRSLNGTKEVAGPGADPVIIGMTDEIGRRYPDMKEYCDQKAWDSDETPWCGVGAGYCMAVSGIRPPFKKGTETDCFGWARSWADDPGYVQQAEPIPGTVVVLQREGGGHVTFFERWANGKLMCRGGNQSNSVNETAFDKANVVAYVWPKTNGALPAPTPKPPDARRELNKGDVGEDVTALQRAIGIPADGDFGSVTETQVKGFQAASVLEIDGVVGPMTWTEVDALVVRMAADEGLTTAQVDEIAALVDNSPMLNYSWPDDRGKAPAGYYHGMALSFAVALTWLRRGDPTAELMARAAGGPDTDALAWYADEFRALGYDNSKAGADTLRHLWTFMVGLGMRESSGRYCEGRDLSASNTSSDTCEAGLFQQSWDSHGASPEFLKLLNLYWARPRGFLSFFSEGINPTVSNLSVYGTGQGAVFQWLAKFSPLFACMSAAVCLRVLRKHFGPVNRKEVDLVDDVEDLLFTVQDVIEKGEPEPEPDPDKPVVQIESVGDVQIFVNGKLVS